MPNQYGNGPIKIGLDHRLEGVGLYIPHPDTGVPTLVFRVEPEFARDIAQNLTLESFKVDDMREKYSGGGSNG